MNIINECVFPSPDTVSVSAMFSLCSDVNRLQSVVLTCCVPVACVCASVDSEDTIGWRADSDCKT